MNGVLILGPDVPCGVYVLWIEVETPCCVRFGRFAGGRVFELLQGAYLYVGSAMGRHGATSLAHRLVRHTVRSNGEAHGVQPTLLATLAPQQICPPGRKQLRWHIDYLLDLPAAEMTGIIAVRSMLRLEQTLADALAQQAWTTAVATGLGASDRRNASHLLRVTGDRSACSLELLGIVRTFNLSSGRK